MLETARRIKGQSRRVEGEVRGQTVWREVRWELESQKLFPCKGREPSMGFEQLSLMFNEPSVAAVRRRDSGGAWGR